MEEDLLLGIESKIGRKHFFFADLDDKDWEKAKEKCKLLVEKYFDRVWLLFSGNGFHIAAFEPISLNKLIKINEEIKADEKFIIYIKTSDGPEGSFFINKKGKVNYSKLKIKDFKMIDQLFYKNKIQGAKVYGKFFGAGNDGRKE